MKNRIRQTEIIAIIKLLAIVAVACMLGGCPEPGTQTEYITEPCTDPNHGSSCDGNHTHIHDNCNNGTCNHDVYDCLNATQCYRNLTAKLQEARDEGRAKCTAVNCKTGAVLGVCDDNITRDFRSKAFDIWAANHRSAHDVSYNPSPNGSDNGVIVTEGLSGAKLAPCLKPAEMEQAKQAALAAMHHSL